MNMKIRFICNGNKNNPFIGYTILAVLRPLTNIFKRLLPTIFVIVFVIIFEIYYGILETMRFVETSGSSTFTKILIDND